MEKRKPIVLSVLVRGVAFFSLFTVFPLMTMAQQWPVVNPEAKPGARWWWLGSAVDKENLQWSMQEYAKHGIGALEITPLYGVKGNESNNIPFLSDKWMEMLRYTEELGKQNGIEIDMVTGTGWPFGGPWVPLEESACRAVFVEQSFIGNKVENMDLRPTEEKERKNAVFHKAMLFGHNGSVVDVTDCMTDGFLNWKATKDERKLLGGKDGSKTVVVIYIKYGVMKVKRAAPGGEGLVVDHFDRKAVANYLKHIEDAFERTHTPYPHTFFNDSYEVADATWTPTLFEEFQKRRGYRLEDHLLAFTHGDVKLVSDYRETLSDMLLENFTQQWTAWAHSHGAITRNQAHGSPANLIDCYAAVDIPEIEGFGLSDFGIKGLRQDPGKTRKNDSDYSMFKYAPSAAHICGKPYTSSETFTWLTEHFRTSLSQFKPDIDLMFCAGVNHMFFHGTCYSPKDDPWPGWKFYASIDMSPTNTIWRDAPAFMEYVEHCQSFLQWGQPDNDFLVFLPVRDMWKKNPDKLLMQFSIHEMGKLAPEFIKTILDIDKAGFDCDYISERLLMGCKVVNGQIETAAGTRYKALLIPGSGDMPEEVKAHIEAMKAQGAKIIHGTAEEEMKTAANPETMKTKYGLNAIRRKNPTGYHYFIANLTPQDVKESIIPAVEFQDAMWFDPLTGERYAANVNGRQILLNLCSGQSMILQTFNEKQEPTMASDSSLFTLNSSLNLDGPWTLSFIEEAPKVGQTFTLDKLQTWETLSDETRVTMGTGVYETTVTLKKKDLKQAAGWKIDLGDVRESARVYINGQYLGCAWSLPFVLDCKNTLKAGQNTIRIEVTNLPANRIADLDRKGVKWRKMEEINFVDINYRNTLYDKWEPMPSGLNSQVRLLRYDYTK
ncbi:MAG: glycosyl hydrolase family 2 [Prevotella sp.]|nr:glycosyl hydrolase family 2 [Prevotella sp.]